MFKGIRRASESEVDKPEDERKIEKDARVAITASREQIERARGILEKEVRRLDAILAKR